MALGPIRGTDLRDHEVQTLVGMSLCRVCVGRGWLWVADDAE
jgi:hypothetical protein